MAFEMMPRFTLPGEELAKAPTEMSDIMAKILQGKQKQQELQQTSLANEQLNKYRMGELGVSQQTQADAHRKALQEQEFYNKFFGNKQQPTQMGSPSPINPPSSLLNNNSLGGKSIGNIVNRDQSQVINPPKQNLSLADRQKQLESGQETLIRSSTNPDLQQFDRSAGMKFGNIQIPDIKSNIVDGIKYDTYPSGKIIAQKVGPTQEEKAKVNLNAAEEKEQAKADIKEKKDIRSHLQNLVQYAENNKAVADIFERNPAATGIFPWSKKYFKLGNKDTGALNRLIVPMVGTLGKELSQRGGAAAIQFAQGGKYDISQPDEYNQGILESQNDAIIRDYEREANNYREKFKEEPPFKLPKYYPDWKKKRDKETGMITIIDSHGYESEIHKSRLDEAKKMDPGVKVKENKNE